MLICSDVVGFLFSFTELLQKSNATTAVWHEAAWAALQQVTCARSTAAQLCTQPGWCCFVRRWGILGIPCSCSRAAPAPPQALLKPTGVFTHCSVCFGLDLHGQHKVANVSVHCPWAFLSLESLQGTLPLVFWVIWIKFLHRADCVPVLLSVCLKSWRVLIVFSLFLILF